MRLEDVIWWRRWESNPRPKIYPRESLRACPAYLVSRPPPPTGGMGKPPARVGVSPQALRRNLRLARHSRRLSPSGRARKTETWPLIKQPERTAHRQLSFSASLTRPTDLGTRSAFQLSRRNLSPPPFDACEMRRIAHWSVHIHDTTIGEKNPLPPSRVNRGQPGRISWADLQGPSVAEPPGPQLVASQGNTGPVESTAKGLAS